MRACRIDSSSCCIISYVYVFAGGSFISITAMPSSTRYPTSCFSSTACVVAIENSSLVRYRSRLTRGTLDYAQSTAPGAQRFLESCSVAVHHAVQEHLRHYIGKRLGVRIHLRAMPRVNPIHHAE